MSILKGGYDGILFGQFAACGVKKDEETGAQPSFESTQFSGGSGLDQVFIYERTRFLVVFLLELLFLPLREIREKME
jgi:hypothetical protein